MPWIVSAVSSQGLINPYLFSDWGDRFISPSQPSSMANPSRRVVCNGMRRVVVWTMKLKFNLLQRSNELTLGNRERERRTGGAEGYKTTFRRRRRDICTNTLRIKRARRQTTDEDSVFLINWMVNRRTWYRLWQSLNLDKRRLKDLHLLMVSNWFSHSLQIISIGLLQLIYSLQSHPLLRMFARFADEQCNSRDICRFNDISNSISLGDVVRRLDTGCPLDYWSSSRITTRILADRNQVRP